MVVFMTITSGRLCQRQDYDLERTKVLETYGYFVLRFANDEVLGNIDIVLAKIAEAAEARIAP